MSDVVYCLIGNTKLPGVGISLAYMNILNSIGVISTGFKWPVL